MSAMRASAEPGSSRTASRVPSSEITKALQAVSSWSQATARAAAANVVDLTDDGRLSKPFMVSTKIAVISTTTQKGQSSSRAFLTSRRIMRSLWMMNC